MLRTFTSHKWLAAGAVLGGLTVLWAVSHGTAPAQAQTSPYVRAFNFGPVLVGPEQSFLLSYSNLFGSRPYAVRARLFDASTGQSLGAPLEGVVAPGTAFVLAPTPNPNQGFSNLTAQANGLVPVVGVLELADPRPTPLVSLQIVSQGRVVALADPRPTPLADPRPTP